MPEYNPYRKVDDMELLIAYVKAKFPGENNIGYRISSKGLTFSSSLLKMIYPRLFDDGRFLHLNIKKDKFLFLNLKKYNLRSRFYIGSYDSYGEVKAIADAVAYKMFNKLITTINIEEDHNKDEHDFEEPKIIHKFSPRLNSRIYSGSEIYLEEEVFKDNLFELKLGNYLEIFPDLLKECVDENYRF